MAELAIGIIGLAALVRECINWCDYIHQGKSLGKDFVYLTAQFDALRTRLQVWTNDVALNNPEHRDPRFMHPEVRRGVQAQLNVIRDLFADVSKHIKLYEVKEQLVYPAAVQTTVQELVKAEDFTVFLDRIHKTQRQAKIGRKIKWAFRDKESFQVLVQRLEPPIKHLEWLKENLHHWPISLPANVDSRPVIDPKSRSLNISKQSTSYLLSLSSPRENECEQRLDGTLNSPASPPAATSIMSLDSAPLHAWRRNSIRCPGCRGLPSRRQQRSKTEWSLIKIFRTTFEPGSAHGSNCPHYERSSWTDKAFQVQVPTLTGERMLEACLALSFVSPAWSLPTVTIGFSALVPVNTPAFSLFFNKMYAIRANSELSPFLKDDPFPEYCIEMVQEICHFALEGKNSVSDTTASGSLVQIAFEFLETLYYAIPDDRRLSAEELQDFLEGCEILLGNLLLKGAPPNSVDGSGWTLLDNLILRWPCEHFGPLVTKLISRYDLKYSSASRHYRIKSVSRALEQTPKRIFDFGEVIECGELGDAVLSKSEAEVQQILQRHPECINETNALGQTALHLAKDWPIGLKLLLAKDASMDQPDRQYFLLLHYACNYGCIPAIDILLNHGSPLYTDGETQDIVKWCFRLSGKPEVETLLIETLAKRRLRLCALALQELSPETRSRLCLQKLEVLDGKAADAYNALLEEKVAVVPALRVPTIRTTVYHCDEKTEPLGIRVADALFQLGFYDVDGLDNLNRTPAMLFQNIRPEYLQWLILHGADLSKSMPTDATLTLGCLIAEWLLEEYLKVNFNFNRDPYESLTSTPNQRATLAQGFLEGTPLLKSALYGLECYDRCVCPCSTKGCMPITAGLKAVFRSIRGDGFANKEHKGAHDMLRTVVRLFYHVLNDHEAESVLENSGWTTDSILRFLTFEALGIVHTCCRYNPGTNQWCSFDLEDRSELWEEDSTKIDSLDMLLDDLMTQYAKMNLPLLDFLQQYWLHSMETAIPETREFTVNDQVQLERIGIRIYDVQDRD